MDRQLARLEQQDHNTNIQVMQLSPETLIFGRFAELSSSLFFLLGFWNLANAPIDCGHAPVWFGISGGE